MNRSRRIVQVGTLLAVMLLATAISGAASGGPKKDKAKGPNPALVKKLQDSARGSVTLSSKQSTGYVGFARAGRNGDLLPADSGASAKSKAREFLGDYGALFGVDDASLVETTTLKDVAGGTHVSYKQVYKGIPVFGGELRAHVDRNGNLIAVNGTGVPDIDIDTSPRLSAPAAAARAISAVAADPPGSLTGVSASDLRAASTTLYVYRTGLIRGLAGTNQLVYEVVVTNGSNIRDVVFVHANAGKIVNRYSTIDDALFRRLFEMNLSTQVWQEGDPFPGSLNQDQQNIVNFSGETYRFFSNVFGRDSYDANGAEMRSVNNDPTIACPNANWNGATTNYCNGVTSDDVVAHEWGHAYTQFTHDLIYQWQPGALNESYSDIWGEVVDLINGVGTDTPNTTRGAGKCSTHTAPRPNVVINSPAAIARTCNAAAAQFGPALTTTGVTGDVVLALDDTAAPGPSTTDACSPLTNAGAVAGNIAIVDRGGCGFTVKVKNAQLAGAAAVLVAENQPVSPAGMAGVDPTIVIPSVRITTLHGNLIKGALPGVNVTIRVGLGTTSEDSYRWLLAEDSTAFGGAIRDMWDPNCINDPGKVTDGMYHCTPDDNGGVHSNSGIPNHGFALLVDGGMYNGVTVNAIGMTKAAHIYFRAQSVYQVLTTDFTDHADALEQSCSDLIGDTLEGLSTTTPAGPSGEVISAADCNAVAAMIAAVEFRDDPTQQCAFRPLLSPNTPSLCANQPNPPTHYHEDFEDGLAGWTLSNQGVFAGWPGTNWVQATSLPAGRAGAAAFGEDLQIGNCDGGAGDVSGVMRLQSPRINIPASATLSPRLTFVHYIATEQGWDGGNVKISINGGPFEVVPAAAFTFNPYNQNLNTAAQGNTNPLAGQPGYTGTDGGEVTSTWGESQIDLTLARVKAGDRIVLRFDMGMDGCTGIDGWYVDDVKVRSCNAKKADVNKVTAKDD